MSAPISTSTGAEHAAVLGLGSYRPRRVVPNSEILEHIDSSDEWIQTRSGIKERRWAEADETVLMMSTEAAKEALADAGVDPAQIGCVVVATVTHLYQTPAIATQIAVAVGAPTAAAFDISAACAGFCYGIALANDLVRGGSAKYVLVIGVERLSDITDRTDRGTAFIFADGAGAAVVGPSDEAGIGPVVWGSDGTQHHVISQKESWQEASGSYQWPHLTMDGNPVFRWASFEMAKTAQQALDVAGVKAEDLDLFVPHQANMRITDAMRRTLKLPDHVTVARDIERQGNTSAASVPLAISTLRENGEAKSGDLALIIGFGAGLVFAAQVIRLP
ncbi:3-oxoacyl-(acyl-carrier-protein) synthase III [Kribbella flavida DSM 17836]|uniref:Beta-ketoacyl-[acyl-carrier-protein] synthase III n=1 Tax=Kribbella flavida (strain DSM 17836 / JCM 10339 / NBRC 14399) TaxID=479435 RepID=D2PXJ4_KRIFD|nr:beta-ketoacyl-ACP synthase III [Kribbella flavida]ADB31636.1 3-oxoacyl-(acyl-carrier-protein) synthase III [Kribbella flavida DSM 17836]